MVPGADGYEYLIDVSSRGHTTWLTVEREDVGWLLLHERFPSVEAAGVRASEVEARLRSGEWRPTVSASLKRKVPKVGPPSFFALEHPFLVALTTSLFVASVAKFNGESDGTAAALGALMFLLQTVLWFPKYGPVRRYTERLLAAEHERGGRTGTD